MSEHDRDVLNRLEKLEKFEKAMTALVNKGKGFWFALIVVGSIVSLFLAAAWEVVTHWRAGG